MNFGNAPNKNMCFCEKLRNRMPVLFITGVSISTLHSHTDCTRRRHVWRERFNSIYFLINSC